MKYINLFAALSIFLLVVLPSPVKAQSNCVSQAIKQFYKHDAGALAVKQMFAAGNTTDIKVPPALYQRIENGMSAIFNSASPERDSVFDIYCIHDSYPIVSERNLVVFFDDSYPWTSAWKNGQTVTGYAQLDQFLSRYNLSVTSYANYPNLGAPYTHCVYLQSQEVLHMNVAKDSLKKFPGIIIVEKDAAILSEPVGAINFSDINNVRQYEFILMWGDCLAGCINKHAWVFNVDDDCKAVFSHSWDQYSPQGPLPAPVNCNISGIPLGIKNPSAGATIRVYPAPAADYVHIEGMKGNTAVLINQTGAVIREITITKASETIDVRDLSNGGYWLRDNMGSVARILVIH